MVIYHNKSQQNGIKFQRWEEIALITSWSYKIHCKLPNISYDPCIILIIVGSGSGKTNAFNQHQPETDKLF